MHSRLLERGKVRNGRWIGGVTLLFPLSRFFIKDTPHAGLRANSLQQKAVATRTRQCSSANSFMFDFSAHAKPNDDLLRQPCLASHDLKLIGTDNMSYKTNQKCAPCNCAHQCWIKFWPPRCSMVNKLLVSKQRCIGFDLQHDKRLFPQAKKRRACKHYYAGVCALRTCRKNRTRPQYIYKLLYCSISRLRFLSEQGQPKKVDEVILVI